MYIRAVDLPLYVKYLQGESLPLATLNALIYFSKFSLCLCHNHPTSHPFIFIKKQKNKYKNNARVWGRGREGNKEMKLQWTCRMLSMAIQIYYSLAHVLGYVLQIK
jgi:hypothetical protein